MENTVSPVSCPVCTLYMREGVTLQSHLNTHPKDQVIAALVRVSASGSGKDSQNESEATEEVTAPSSSGSSHFTTAITYQQFLSSNGSTVVPQYVSMPTILSPPGSMQMLYSPYMAQQQMLSSVTSPAQQQQPFIRLYPPQLGLASDTVPLNMPYHVGTFPPADFATPALPQGFQSATNSPSLPASSSCPPAPPSDPPVANKPDSPLPEQHRSEEVASIEVDLPEHSAAATQTSTTQFQDDDQKSSCKDEEVIDSEQGMEEGTVARSPSSESVRVRRDLNDAAVNSEEEVTVVEKLPSIVNGSLKIQDPPESVPDNDEYITGDRQREAEEDKAKDTSEEDQSKVVDGFLELDAAETVNIIEIDGIHILVPSQFLENPATVLGGKLTGNESITLSPEEESPPARDPEPATSAVPSLNIQTDETMPPRGELSEQESVGGNDSSMWLQTFQEKEVSTSYDLLARESWEASDGSDVDVIPETSVSSSKQRDQSGTQNRVYKCGTCGEQFNCPKERRVHQRTYHSEKSEAATSGSGGKTGEDGVGRRPPAQKRRSRMKKVIKEEEDENCVKAEEPQFMGVFIQEDTETKMETEGEVDEPTTENNVLAEGSAVVPKEEADLPKNENSPDTTFLCTECNQVFPTSKLRSCHMRTVHKKLKAKKNVCGTCKESFSTDSEYHSHLQSHPLECSQCGKYFFRRQNLELHLKRHLGIKPHKCTICDKAFVTKQKLAEHTNSHTGNAPIKCPMCDETFRRYSNLIQHKHRHHLNVKKKVKDFICHCGEIFHSKKKLEWHKEIHEEKPKCCTYCSERFVHASSLTRHIRKAHDCRYVPKCGREVENIECTVCGYVFLKGSLQVHMRMHKGERPYPCHVCGKDFTTKWNLQLHRWTHAARSSKPFKCSLCKSAFFRRNDYTAHMHSHRNVRPYTCNHCGCQFIRKYNCLRHVREHEIGKAFSCNVCGKMFHRSYYLKEHMRVHSGARPFACHICGKASSTKSNHNKHVKIHHAREPVNTEG